MPLSLEGRYTTRSTQSDIEHNLRELYGPDVTKMDIMHISHNPPKEGATRPGTNPLFFGISEITGINPSLKAISIAEHGSPSEQAINYTEDRGGKNITLPDILAAVPEFITMAAHDPMLADLSMNDMMRMHGETVHLLSYLNSHDTALRTTMQSLNLVDKDVEATIATMLDDQTRHAAAFVDATVATWISRNRSDVTFVDRDDWPPVNVVVDLNGNPVRADVGNNHGLVPQLKNILKMHPIVQEHALQTYRNMIIYNDALALHTQKDAQFLQEIADHLGISEDQRAEVFVRDLVPPSFVDFSKLPEGREKPAPFLEEAVKKGRMIAGVVERLDPIKMDHTVLDNLEYMLKDLRGTPEGEEIITNLRIAMVARPANFPDDWKMKQIYGTYNNSFIHRVDDINRLFKKISGMDEDFILLHKDSNGNPTGYPHNSLRAEVFPYYDIAFQLGQEGLCQTIQEAGLTRAFRSDDSLPAITIVSELTGFAEKAQQWGMDHVLPVKDPTNPDETSAKFVQGYRMAKALRENPGHSEIQQIKDRMIAYYDHCGDSFYPGLLDALITKRKRQGKIK